MEEKIGRILDMASSEGYECEVYGEVLDSYHIEVYRGEIESVDRSRDTGIGIRLMRDGRIGHTFSNEMGVEGLRGAFEEAKRNSACSSSIDVDVLADGGDIGERPSVCAFHLGEDPAFKVEGVREMERAAFGHDSSIENTEGASYSEVSGEIFVAGTRGFFRREKRGSCSCSLSAIARDGEEVRTGWFYSQSTDVRSLDFASVGLKAAGRACGLLDCRQIGTGRYDILMDPVSFIDIIYLLEQALSGEMAVKGTTVFAGRTGERVAPAIFTLVDDPFLEGGCLNATFDDEGSPRIRNVLIEEGMMKRFLNNAYSHRKTGSEPTANAVRSSYRDLPVPGPTNLFVAPGSRGIGAIIADMDEGIYVQSIMGMHTADPISGDFSVGINGRHIHGGEAGAAISEMTISGNILDLLGRIREIGSEIIFMGPYGAPPVLVEGISVSGT